MKNMRKKTTRSTGRGAGPAPITRTAASAGRSARPPARSARPAATTARPAARTARPATSAKPGAKAKPAAATAPDPKAMMEAWQRTMTPGSAHKRLEPLVGTWTTRTSFTMEPGAPPQEGSGVSENRWVLGGRFVEQTYRGTSAGMPMEGIGYTGFDNATGRYVGSWMDTWCTGIMTSQGTGKPTDREIAFHTSAIDPMGNEVAFRSLVRIQDRDHHSYEMWTKGPDGKEYRAMVVEYARK